MKKLILLVFLATLFTVVTSYSFAQNEVSFAANSVSKREFSIPVNELNSKAARHFSQEFDFARNETWFKIRDGYTAKFSLSDVQYRVGYDKKGNWLNTVKVYYEPSMPKAIRHQVKTSYYDYSISIIEELTIKNLTTYIVHIHNSKEFKKLYLAEGEMEVMEEYSK